MTQPAPAKAYRVGPPDDVLSIKKACRVGNAARLLGQSKQRANQALLVYTQKNPFNAAEAADLLIQVWIGWLIVGADAENQESIRQFELMKERTPAAAVEQAERFLDQMNKGADAVQLELDVFGPQTPNPFD